jgi:hypothetical protein
MHLGHGNIKNAFPICEPTEENEVKDLGVIIELPELPQTH